MVIMVVYRNRHINTARNLSARILLVSRRLTVGGRSEFSKRAFAYPGSIPVMLSVDDPEMTPNEDERRNSVWEFEEMGVLFWGPCLRDPMVLGAC